MKKILTAALVIVFTLLHQFVKSQSCTGWLYLPSQPSYISVGDLDIPGDQVTVEAVFSRTTTWSGIDLFQGDLVSKHEDSKDVNYLLRPSSAEITTSNGYFRTPTICPIQLNKVYHAALVYDGKTLKFYRNGFLMSQIAASGNLVQNNWQTQIGLYFNQLTVENFIGYINEVKIWKVARTQSEINEYMDKPLPSPQTTPGLLAYYVFDNLINKQGNTSWNGSIGGNVQVNKTIPTCTFVADSCGIKPVPICADKLNPDFTFKHNSCSPTTLEFMPYNSGLKEYKWSFGANNISNTVSPSFNFLTSGVQKVKLVVKNAEGCSDSVSKDISLSTISADMLWNKDTAICKGDSITLLAKEEGLSYCWSPSNSLANVGSKSAVAKPLTTTSYTFTSQVVGNNLITNPNFNSGNTSFSSDYGYSSSGISNDLYYVGTSAKSWNAGFAACVDHTTGSGNMLMVNGSDKHSKKAWLQVVSVKPNTNYVFSCWVQSLNSVNPAQIQFVIDGNNLGGAFSAKPNTCEWSQYFIIWNSGEKTTASISIATLNQVVTGNDFAIDDIFFGEYAFKTKALMVTVKDKPFINLGNDISVCRGASLQLDPKIISANKVSWKPITYLSNASILTPIATPATSISYISEIEVNGCTSSDTIAITVLDNPEVNLMSDTTVCQGASFDLVSNSKNAATFNWQPSTGLSSSIVPVPKASISSSTKYTLTVTSAENCSTSKSVTISVLPPPKTTVSKDTSICGSGEVQLLAEGGTQYQWTPIQTLSATNIPNPVAKPLSTTTYYVDVVGSNGCLKRDSIKVSVNPRPSFGILNAPSAVCLGDTVSLTATGGDLYKWSPVSSVLSPNSEITKVVPTLTTTYKVVILNSICKLEDSAFATVKVNPLPTITISKSNDLDCSTSQAHLFVTGGASYEWLTARGIVERFTSNPIVQPTETTTYIVVGKTADGCKAKDSITVNVEGSNRSEFYIPNAFTPNGDGKNDCFGVKKWLGVKEFSLEVFNRWGEKVYSTTNAANCWDGRFKGNEQPGAVYIYYIKAKTICGETVQKGTFSLVR